MFGRREGLWRNWGEIAAKLAHAIRPSCARCLCSPSSRERWSVGTSRRQQLRVMPPSSFPERQEEKREWNWRRKRKLKETETLDWPSVCVTTLPKEFSVSKKIKSVSFPPLVQLLRFFFIFSLSLFLLSMPFRCQSNVFGFLLVLRIPPPFCLYLCVCERERELEIIVII